MLGAVVDVGQAPVVAGEPQQRVVGDAQVAQALAECTDGAVHRDDLGVVRLRTVVQFGEGLLVFREGAEGPVRGGVPDDREHGLAVLRLLRDVAQPFGDQDFRRVAFELLRLSVLAEHRIQVELVRVAQPVVEAEFAGVVGIVTGHRIVPARVDLVQVPLAEVRRRVAGLAERLGDRLLLLVDRVADAEGPGAVVRAARNDGGTGRRAARGASVEAVHAQAGRGHRVEVWRL